MDKKIDLNFLNIYKKAALIIAIIVFVIFLFINLEPGASFLYSNKLGTTGDYFGGLLNPTFAFLGLLALLATIKIQVLELEETRKELTISSQAQLDQSESFKEQNKSLELQTFENTFFKLLDHYNNLIGDFYNEIETINNSNESKFYIITENIFNWESNGFLNSKEAFKHYNKSIIKTYFMTLYQLLKFVDNYANKHQNFDAKFYTNIVRATMDDRILVLLILNCHSYNFIEYKKFISTYSILEHLEVLDNDDDENINAQLLLYDILKEFESDSFGEHKNRILAKIDENYCS